MSDPTAVTIVPQTDSDTATYLVSVAAEIDQLRGMMQRDQITIDRLKAESKIITDHTDSVLVRLRVQLEALGRSA